MQPWPRFELEPGRKYRNRLPILYLPPPEILARSVHIPAGFVSEPSVPRIFWRLLPPIGDYVAAAAVHDWLYQEQKVSRKTADQVFLAAMRDTNVPRWEQVLLYYGVRIGGWHAWRKHSRRRS